MSRLDYWLISNCLSDNVWNVDIIPSIKTDHSAIIIEFKDIEDRVKGPGIWKLNCSLLSDQLYVEEINRLIPSWVQEGKADLSDPCSVWDLVKYNIKNYSIKYSINRCKQRKEKEKLLNIELHEAYVSFLKKPLSRKFNSSKCCERKIGKTV